MAIFSCLATPFRRKKHNHRAPEHPMQTNGERKRHKSRTAERRIQADDGSRQYKHRAAELPAHTSKERRPLDRLPSRIRRKPLPKLRLTVAVSQPADDWSRDTRNMLESAVMRPLPDLPANATPTQTPIQVAAARMGSNVYFRSPIMSPIDEPMSPAVVRSVVATVGMVFEGMAYTVCGLAAMTYYGFRGRRPTQVSLLCPPEAQRVMQCWAVAKGMRPVPDARNAFWLNTHDAGIRRIRMKFTGEFRALSSIRAGPSRTSILTLPSLANMVALGYVHGLQDASLRRQEAYANDMCWILRRIPEIHDEKQCLRRGLVPHVVQRTFWLPFTLSFPDSVALFIRAGLATDVDGRSLRQTVSTPEGFDVHVQRPARRFVRFEDEISPDSDVDDNQTSRATIASSSTGSSTRRNRLMIPRLPTDPWHSIPSPYPRFHFGEDDRPHTDPGSQGFGGFI